MNSPHPSSAWPPMPTAWFLRHSLYLAFPALPLVLLLTGVAAMTASAPTGTFIRVGFASGS
ncbi:hypothetical protein E2542_SST06210 [Spatholobus suberectus]|nr:hypothetical protein E2542_SST06210 [Spatholobus suberectus]